MECSEGLPQSRSYRFAIRCPYTVSLSSCFKMQSHLPVHSVNFAFAYIDPGSYQIVTMDSSTPSSLFQDTGNLKSIKQDLTIFVSVGGW